MLKSRLCGHEVSRLGFGAMRLPTLSDGSIDIAQTAEMTDIAIKNGVNYFDTAFPYHAGKSETVMGDILKSYPRDSFYLATKYPGHQISKSYDPAAIFEEQLGKCSVDHFDFYLLHNVCENSFDVYNDPKWGIIDYFVRQREEGRIRHLGFSTHARPETLEKFLSLYGDKLEFCQIQLNYLDWTLQNAKAKYELLDSLGIPVVVMEPVHGGKLAHLGGGKDERLSAARPDESSAAWAFRWLQALPNVKVVLSGMSSLAQMKENVSVFESEKPLSEDESTLLLSIAEELKNAVPCTACRYCCDGCPAGLDIPVLIGALNDLRFEKSFTVSMQLDAMPADKLPTACIGCGACESICPQNIEIPKLMRELADMLPTLPSWAEICKKRDEEAQANRKA